MHRSFLILLGLLLTGTAGAGTTERELLVHFDKDRSTLTAPAAQRLEEFLAGIDLDGDVSFTVEGHTDSDGALSYNDALAEARALEVLDFLVAHGVPAALVSLGSAGERNPMAANASEAGMALNRRVRLTCTFHAFADLADLRTTLAAGSRQGFTIDPTREQVLQGAEGTQVYLPANVLVDARGRPCTEPVEIYVTEALGLEAILGHQLSTRSGDALLETGGMMRIEALDASGGELGLAPGAALAVSLPTDQRLPGMQLFTSTDGGDWSATGQPASTSMASFSWQEPRPPYIDPPAFRWPKYVEDRAGRPIRPGLPGPPVEPLPPRRESLQRTPRWYQFWARQRVEQENEARFAAAMKNHERDLRRYEKRMVRFRQDTTTYDDRLAAYTLRKEEWDAQKLAEYNAWCDDVLARAKEQYGELLDSQQGLRDSLMTQWRQQRASSLEEYAARMDSIRLPQQNLRQYAFSVSTLGWINCDRFPEVPFAAKHSPEFADTDPDEEDVFLVFTGIRSILRCNVREPGKRYSSPPVPRNQPIQLLAYKVVDGRVHVCNSVVTPGRTSDMQFRPSSYTELGNLLRQLSSSPS